MKKLIKVLIVLVLAVSVLMIHVHEDEHHHVHALSAGDSYGTCPNCGGTMTIDYIGEQFCDREGVAYASCFHCGAVENMQVSIPATGHNYQPSSAAGTPATCTQGGIVFYVCSNCGDSYQETTNPLGHNYVASITKEATCEEAGARTMTCSRCGDTYNEEIAATGHNYRSEVTKKATCTQSGTTTYTCTKCNDSYTETIKALGHDYRSKVTKKATCTEDGEEIYTCSRCNSTYAKTIKALGHDYEYEETEPTCLEDGIKKGVCKNCRDETEEIVPALGHDLGEFKVVKEATCTEDGKKEAVCRRCDETVEEIIPMTGHSFPEDWIVDKEPTFFEEGISKKVCPDCGEILTEMIPKKNILPLVLGGAGGLALLGGSLWFFLRKNTKTVTKVVEEAVEKGGVPEISSKTVVVASKDEELVDLFKKRRYLEVIRCEYEEIEDTVAENEPDLLISDVLSDETLEEILGKKDELFKDTPLGIVTVEEVVEDNREKLDQLVKDKMLVNYVLFGADKYEAMTKLILPLIKPELHSDESLDNIGLAADLLGIPGVSTIISAYVAGREIKSTIEEGELGVSSAAIVIADIASILGLDTVAGVAGLVDDVETVKAAIDKEAGSYEKGEGYNAAKDIVEVVSDLIDKG